MELLSFIMLSLILAISVFMLILYLRNTVIHVSSKASETVSLKKARKALKQSIKEAKALNKSFREGTWCAKAKSINGLSHYKSI